MFEEQFLTIQGPNFSGRTKYLRQFSGLENLGEIKNDLKVPNAYIGPDIANYFSGIAPTVEKELEVHGLNSSRFKEPILKMIHDFGMAHLLSRNPFTLSGGEQTFFAALNALALAPCNLAMDCILEQLNSQLRQKLLGAMQYYLGDNGETAVRICDNRLTEYTLEMPSTSIESITHSNDNRGFGFSLSGLNSLNYSVNPCSIKLDGISFSYTDNILVLDRLDYEFLPGKIYLLTGENGAGKSTLSRLMAGIIKPRNGNLYRNGMQLIRPWKKPAQEVAYHFQNPDMQLFSTTVRAELGIKGTPQDENSQFIWSVIRLFGLEDVLEKHPFDLPFVLRKRIAMAATIIMQRPWIIMDEPTLGQDDSTMDKLIEIFHSLALSGVGLIIISHSSRFSERVGATVLRLENGRIKEPQI